MSQDEKAASVIVALLCGCVGIAMLVHAINSNKALQVPQRTYTVIDATGQKHRNLTGSLTRSYEFETNEGKKIFFHGSFTVFEE